MTDEEKALFRGLYEALRATNVSLSAAITEIDILKRRITQLEAAKFRCEAPWLPPAEKMN